MEETQESSSSKPLTKSSRKRLRKRQAAALEKFILASEAAGSCKIESLQGSNPESVEIRGCLSNIVFHNNSVGEKEFFVSNKSLPQDSVNTTAKSACCEDSENLSLEKNLDVKQESIVPHSKRKRNGKKGLVSEVSDDNPGGTVVFKSQKIIETQTTQQHGASKKDCHKQKKPELSSSNPSVPHETVVAKNKDSKKVEAAEKLDNTTDFKQQEETSDRASTLSRSKRRRIRKKAITSLGYGHNPDQSVDDKGIKSRDIPQSPQLATGQVSPQSICNSGQRLYINQSISISSEQPESDAKTHAVKNNTVLKCVETAVGKIGRNPAKIDGKPLVSTLLEKVNDIGEKTCDPNCKISSEKKKGISVKEVEIHEGTSNLEKENIDCVVPEHSVVKSKHLEKLTKSEGCESLCQKEHSKSSLVFQKTGDCYPTILCPATDNHQTVMEENHPTNVEGTWKNISKVEQVHEESSDKDKAKNKPIFFSKGVSATRKAAPVQFDEVDRSSATMDFVTVGTESEGEKIFKPKSLVSTGEMHATKMHVVSKGASLKKVVPAVSEVFDESVADLNCVRVEEKSEPHRNDDNGAVASSNASANIDSVNVEPQSGGIIYISKCWAPPKEIPETKITAVSKGAIHKNLVAPALSEELDKSVVHPSCVKVGEKSEPHRKDDNGAVASPNASTNIDSVNLEPQSDGIIYISKCRAPVKEIPETKITAVSKGAIHKNLVAPALSEELDKSVVHPSCVKVGEKSEPHRKDDNGAVASPNASTNIDSVNLEPQSDGIIYISKCRAPVKEIPETKITAVSKGAIHKNLVAPALSEELDKLVVHPSCVKVVEKSEPRIKDDNGAVESSNAVDQSKEKVKAEREARKAAKLAKKQKGKTTEEVKDVTETHASPLPVSIRHDPVNKEGAEMSEGKPKVLPPQVSQDGERSSGMGKSKAELRAERRAKQEAQRAAKAAVTPNEAIPAQGKEKSVKQAVSRAVPLKGDKARPKQPSPNLKGLRKEPGAKLLSRLGWGDGRVKRSNSEDATLKETQAIHPAIVQLSTRFTDRIVSGSNARCLAFVQAIKKAILDYQTPPQKELGRDMEARLLTPSLAYLESQRPHAISVLNATKFLKWQLTQLQPLQPCSLDSSSVSHSDTKKAAVISDEEAKKTLIDGLDAYIWEKIEVAEQAVCDTLRDKIKDGDVILTYGCSYLLQQILTGAKKSGTKFKVMVVDGRPWREGREMLRCLVGQGIPCSYVLLSAASSVMRQVNKVLLGAHALLSNGYVMSRVGVSQVALLASAHNVPVLVACETHKFCERVQSDSFVYNEMGEPDGLAQLLGGEDSPLSDWRSIPSLSLLNLSYDVTPPELVTAVATELAVLPCTSVPVVLRVQPAEPIVSRH